MSQGRAARRDTRHPEDRRETGDFCIFTTAAFGTAGASWDRSCISRKKSSLSECKPANIAAAEMLASLLPTSISGAQSRGFGILPGSALCFSSSPLALTCSSATTSSQRLKRRRTVKPLEKVVFAGKQQVFFCFWFYNTQVSSRMSPAPQRDLDTQLPRTPNVIRGLLSGAASPFPSAKTRSEPHQCR